MKKLGTIKLNGTAILSDPCYGYNPDGYAVNTLVDVVEGEYNVYITQSLQKYDLCNHKRVSNIIAVHKDYIIKGKQPRLPKNDRDTFYCSVDSGTCGIFSDDYYRENHHADDVMDDWYEENVVKMDKYSVCDGLGAICSSGWGDGFYPVFLEYDGNKAYALRIRFI